jgi:hypothetical protein
MKNIWMITMAAFALTTGSALADITEETAQEEKRARCERKLAEIKKQSSASGVKGFFEPFFYERHEYRERNEKEGI